MATEDINIKLNIVKGNLKGLADMKKSIDNSIKKLESTYGRILQAKTPQQRGGFITSFNRQYETITKNVDEYSKHLTTANKLSRIQYAGLNAQVRDFGAELSKLNLKYKSNIIAMKKFHLETAKGRIAFQKYFGVLLSSMFIFKQMASAFTGFIRQSINAYLQMAANNDAIAKSLMFIKGGFDAFRYSFVQALSDTGLLDFFAQKMTDFMNWWQSLKPETKEFVIKLTIAGAAISVVISQLAQIGILMLALKQGAPAVYTAVVGAFGGIFKFLTIGFSVAGKFVVAFFSSLTSLGITGFAVLGALIVGWLINWKKTINTIKEFFTDMFSAIKEVIKNWVSGAVDIFGGFVKILKGDLWGGFKDIMTGIAKIFLGSIDFILSTAYGLVKGFINLMIDAVEGLIKGVVWAYNKITGKHVEFSFDKRLPEWKSNLTDMGVSAIETIFNKVAGVQTKEAPTVNNNIVVNVNTPAGPMSPSPAQQYFSGEIIGGAVANELKRQGIGFY